MPVSVPAEIGEVSRAQAQSASQAPALCVIPADRACFYFLVHGALYVVWEINMGAEHAVAAGCPKRKEASGSVAQRGSQAHLACTRPGPGYSLGSFRPVVGRPPCASYCAARLVGLPFTDAGIPRVCRRIILDRASCR